MHERIFEHHPTLSWHSGCMCSTHEEPTERLPQQTPHWIQFQELLYTKFNKAVLGSEMCVRAYACLLTSLVTGGLGKSIRINPGCVTVKNIPSYSSRMPFVTRLSLPILYPSIGGENKGDPKASGKLSKEGTRPFFTPASCARFRCDLIKVNKRQLLYREDSASQVCHIDLFHCPCRASHSVHTC